MLTPEDVRHRFEVAADFLRYTPGAQDLVRAALPLSPLVVSTQRSWRRVGSASAGTPLPVFPRSQAPTPDQS